MIQGSEKPSLGDLKSFNLEDEYNTFLDILEEYLERESPEAVTHYGVKGMKWGIRREDKSPRAELRSLGPDRIVRKTKSGEEIVMSKNPPTRLHKFLARISKDYREEYQNNAFLDIRDSKGKSIGEAEVSKKSADELNLVWLGINKGSRGKGYATAVMGAAVEFGRREGFKRLTLEVPGNSPDARHIYEKLGFRVVKEASSEEAKKDPAWGGLTDMIYEIKSESAKHSDNLNNLSHYGIKGMKWGVRKPDTTKAHLDSIQRRTALGTRLRENRPADLEERIGRRVGIALYGGTKRYNKRLDKELKSLKARRRRVAAGREKVSDYLDYLGNVTIIDSYVSRIDNKG